MLLWKIRRVSALTTIRDFNINYVINDNNFPNNQKWYDCIKFYGLEQVVHKPTRVTDVSSTIIDHIYTTNVEHIIEVNVPICGLSDHYPVCVTRKLNPKLLKKEHLNIEYRSFKNFDQNLFTIDLANSPFHEVESFSDVDEAIAHWYKLFMNILDKHAPKKIRRVKHSQQPEW